MANNMRLPSTLPIVLLLALSACTGAVNPRATPPAEPSSTLLPSAPTATVIPSPEPFSWVGPLLYLPWHTNTRSSDLPIYDLGAEKTVYLTTTEPIYDILDWSPDGCLLAYAAGDKAEARVRLLNIVTREDRVALTLPHVDPIRVDWNWSPSGEWVTYGFSRPENGEVVSEGYLIRPDGTASTPLPAAGAVDWLPGERQLLYWAFEKRPGTEYSWEGTKHYRLLDLESMQSREVAHWAQPLNSWSDLAITDVNTMQPVRLEMPGVPGEPIYAFMYWTPDLRHILFTTVSDCGDNFCGVLQLDLIDLPEGQVRRLNARPYGEGSSSFTLDGMQYAFIAQGFEEDSRETRAYLLDLATGQWSRIGGKNGPAFETLKLSPDGSMLSFSEYPHCSVYSLETGKVSALPDEFCGWLSSPAWLPRMSYGPGACVDRKP